MDKDGRTLEELTAPRNYTRDGEQYELFVPMWVVEPWGGKSPRVLTRAWEKFSLGAHPPGGLIRNA